MLKHSIIHLVRVLIFCSLCHFINLQISIVWKLKILLPYFIPVLYCLLSIWHSCVIQDFDEQFMHNLQDILLTSICAFKLCCFEVKTALSLPYLPIVNRCQLQHYLSTDHHFIDIVEKQDFDRKIYCDFCASRLLHSVYSFIGQLIKCDISCMFMWLKIH